MTIKTCGCCGAKHTPAGWASLKLVGVQRCAGGPDLELRNCACSSTLAIEVQS